MKVVPHGTAQNRTAGPVVSQHLGEGKPAAFEQTLRSMEKQMWPGAMSGRMDTMKLPAVDLPSSRGGNLQLLNAAASASSAATAGLNSNAQAPAGIAWDIAGRSVDASARLANAQATAQLRAAASTASPPTPPLLTQAVPARLAPSRVPESAETGLSAGNTRHTTAPTRPVRPIAPLTHDAACGGDAPPYRVSVLPSAHGVLVAVRINGATRADSRALSQRALAELRRQGLHDASVVVNGLTPDPVESQGEPHAD